MVFHSLRVFLIHEVILGFRDLSPSLDFILDSGNSLSLLTLDADCLSADRSHVHGPVEELLVHLVHAIAGDRVTLFNNLLEEVILQLVAFWADELSFWFSFPYVFGLI